MLECARRPVGLVSVRVRLNASTTAKYEKADQLRVGLTRSTDSRAVGRSLLSCSALGASSLLLCAAGAPPSPVSISGSLSRAEPASRC